MKLSESKLDSSAILFYAVLAVALVPNVALFFTEGLPITCALANIVLPLGAYWWLMSLSTHIGRSTLWMFIVMFLAAFEIVLLDLYGNSVIGVDMWLNVVTSNSNEIGELLGNLLPVILLVCLLYIPPTVAGVVAVKKKWRLDDRFVKRNRCFGGIAFLMGIVLLCMGMLNYSTLSPYKYVFPVNALDNARMAIERYVKTSRYAETSRNYSYGATSTHGIGGKEVYVFVIGETSRAANWEIMGYQRPTNSSLKGKKGLVAFPKTMSESNTTHKSVPLLLSPLTADDFGDSIYVVKGMATAFKEAGFKTIFLSNQERNGSFIDFFGEEADSTVFIKELKGDRHLHDEDLLESLGDILRGDYEKLMVIVHTYGSHFNYHERYPTEFSVFRPDDTTEATRNNRETLLNAYDNSILYTSDLLGRIISMLDRACVASAMLYTSDHGEDIYDDARGLFLHASPLPSAYQLHVPYLLWTSDMYAQLYPDKVNAAHDNARKKVSSSESFFHTALDLAGIRCAVFDSTLSVSSEVYREPFRRYLNDHNEGISLGESGLKAPDFKYISGNGL